LLTFSGYIHKSSFKKLVVFFEIHFSFGELFSIVREFFSYASISAGYKNEPLRPKVLIFVVLKPGVLAVKERLPE